MWHPFGEAGGTELEAASQRRTSQVTKQVYSKGVDDYLISSVSVAESVMSLVTSLNQFTTPLAFPATFLTVPQ
jgi:hypothetical protein